MGRSESMTPARWCGADARPSTVAFDGHKRCVPTDRAQVLNARLSRVPLVHAALLAMLGLMRGAEGARVLAVFNALTAADWPDGTVIPAGRRGLDQRRRDRAERLLGYGNVASLLARGRR
jgi:hypothetical protein